MSAVNIDTPGRFLSTSSKQSEYISGRILCSSEALVCAESIDQKTTIPLVDIFDVSIESALSESNIQSDSIATIGYTEGETNHAVSILPESRTTKALVKSVLIARLTGVDVRVGPTSAGENPNESGSWEEGSVHLEKNRLIVEGQSQYIIPYSEIIESSPFEISSNETIVAGIQITCDVNGAEIAIPIAVPDSRSRHLFCRFLQF